MSRAILASAMLTRLRQMTDAENDTHLTDAELYAALTSAVAETWDVIIAGNGSDIFTKSVSFTSVAGQRDYSLQTLATDFYKLGTLYVDEGNGQLRAIQRISAGEDHQYRPPVQPIPMVMRYIPCAPIFTTGAESFDGINGWEEHTLNTAAIYVKEKKSDDTSSFRSRKREMEARIQTMSQRSMAEPPRVVRKRRSMVVDRYSPWANNITAYLLRGDTLELLYRFGTFIGA